MTTCRVTHLSEKWRTRNASQSATTVFSVSVPFSVVSCNAGSEHLTGATLDRLTHRCHALIPKLICFAATIDRTMDETG